jgi:hypothetical protein
MLGGVWEPGGNNLASSAEIVEFFNPENNE